MAGRKCSICGHKKRGEIEKAGGNLKTDTPRPRKREGAGRYNYYGIERGYEGFKRQDFSLDGGEKGTSRASGDARPGEAETGYTGGPGTRV